MTTDQQQWRRLMDPKIAFNILTGLIASGGPNSPADQQKGMQCISVLSKLINHPQEVLSLDNLERLESVNVELQSELDSKDTEINELKLQNKGLQSDNLKLQTELRTTKGKLTRLMKKLEKNAN